MVRLFLLNVGSSMEEAPAAGGLGACSMTAKKHKLR